MTSSNFVKIKECIENRNVSGLRSWLEKVKAGPRLFGLVKEIHLWLLKEKFADPIADEVFVLLEEFDPARNAHRREDLNRVRQQGEKGCAHEELKRIRAEELAKIERARIELEERKKNEFSIID
jgi:hypothetical protein